MSNINKKDLISLLQASKQAFTAGIDFLLVTVKEDGSPEVIGGHQKEINEIKATLENIFKGGIVFFYNIPWHMCIIGAYIMPYNPVGC